MRAPIRNCALALAVCSCGAEGNTEPGVLPAETTSSAAGMTLAPESGDDATTDAQSETRSEIGTVGDSDSADPGSPSADNSSPGDASSASPSSDDGPGIAPAFDADNGNTMSAGNDDGLTNDTGAAPTPSTDATPTTNDDDTPGDTSDDGSEEGNSNDSDQAGTDGDATSELMGTPTHAERATLPTVRQEHGAAALNGEVYVLGGFTPQVTSSVQAYSPETDSWRDVADFPVEFHHPNVGVVNGLLYVTGFHLGSSLRVADARAFAYDPSADEWTPRSALPAGTERGSACVATLEGKIYLFGGASDKTLPDASVYDTELDSWEVLPLMPALREHCLAAGIDGKIYIVSGRSGSIEGVHVESWMYDPETQMYTERAPIPTPRGGAAGAVIGGRIFVLGGEGNGEASNGIFPQVEAYDPATNSWEAFPDMLFPRHGYAAAAVEDHVYLPGGATSQGFGAIDTHTAFYFEVSN